MVRVHLAVQSVDRHFVALTVFNAGLALTNTKCSGLITCMHINVSLIKLDIIFIISLKMYEPNTV